MSNEKASPLETPSVKGRCVVITKRTHSLALFGAGGCVGGVKQIFGAGEELPTTLRSDSGQRLL
jgi:hypothetical protein